MAEQGTPRKVLAEEIKDAVRDGTMPEDELERTVDAAIDWAEEVALDAQDAQ